MTSNKAAAPRLVSETEVKSASLLSGEGTTMMTSIAAIVQADRSGRADMISGNATQMMTSIA